MKFTTPKGRTVYGGGGIMPDIFIPVDTLYYSPYYNKVWDGNVLYRYTLDFSDRHRKELDRVTTIEQLDSLLDGCNLLEEFIAYAERNGIPRNDADIAKSKEVIKAQIRAYIGRNCMGDDAGFYHNIYPVDDALQRAVKEIKRGNAKIKR
jgi:carboxyl-terminal processing protease